MFLSANRRPLRRNMRYAFADKRATETRTGKESQGRI
jgi:hypothetical protein